MKSKRSRTYLVSGLTLALIFVAIILVFRDVLPDIVKDLSTVPFWGVLLLLALGFAYEAMESVLCLVIIHHKKPDCTFIDALRVTFLGVFGIPFEGAGLIVKILLVAVFSSVAMSGIPGGGYIGEYIICTLFFPAQMAIAYPIAVTIGNLVDPPATMINAAGDYVVTFLVARFTEGKDWLERAQREKAAH